MKHIGKLSEIAEVLGIEQISIEEDHWINQVCIDSRDIVSNALFFAVKGERTDGHLFLESARMQGAVGAVVQKDHPSIDRKAFREDFVLFLVDDVLDGLQQVATWYREHFELPVIAVTGSSGKTTTKDMVRAVLSTKMKVHANHGSFNNEIGLPLTILEMDSDTDALVLEMGMRGLGQITQLCRIAKPNIGVITNIGITHLELLRTPENIYEAKTELLEYMGDRGTCILNEEDRWTSKAKTKCLGKLYSVGFSPSASLIATDLKEFKSDMQFLVHAEGKAALCKLEMLGRHHVLDALEAIQVGLHLGVSLEEGVLGLEKMEISDRRMKMCKGLRNSVILDDCYNANPDSMRASLEILIKDTTRTLAVLGDMLELGEVEIAEHEKIGVWIAEHGVNTLVTVGELALHIALGAKSAGMKNVYTFHSHQEVLDFLLSYIGKGDRILVKGSRAMKMEEIVEPLLGVEHAK